MLLLPAETETMELDIVTSLLPPVEIELPLAFVAVTMLSAIVTDTVLLSLDIPRPMAAQSR